MNYAHPQAVGGLETAWNEFNYAGLDCSGFVGWTLYNTLYDESMVNPGMVDSSTKMANKLANEFKLGEFVHPQQYGFDYAKRLKIAADEYSVGDVVSLQGHVFIVLGKCEDGSLVIVHSTPEYSWDNAAYGYFGGGVMLSPLNPNNPADKNCEAYRLVQKYMTTYYPEWTKRYPVIMKNAFYFSFPANTKTGVFHWNLFNENGLSDPDGYRNMSAEEILKDLFCETEKIETIENTR